MSEHAQESDIPIPVLKGQGRLDGLQPVGVVDIGSNSVRLVVYEGLVRSPTVLFNEKIMCGLGVGVAKTGLLEGQATEMALRTLGRFRGLCRQLQVARVHVLATAAVREAKNGLDFIAAAQDILGEKIRLLSGEEEALYSAYGVLSAFYHPQGIVGDFGGGSLELVPLEHLPKSGDRFSDKRCGKNSKLEHFVSSNETKNALEKGEIGAGISLPLGGLRLHDRAQGSLERARKIVRHALEAVDRTSFTSGTNFYAVGGTWRNLAKLHMAQRKYPLPVMNHYQPDMGKLRDFLRRIAKGDIDGLRGLGVISKNRRQLLPYGAVVLQEIIRILRIGRVIFSGCGVREGYLYAALPPQIQAQDPLLAAAQAMSILRARSAEHAHELITWSGAAFEVLGMRESDEEKRLREATCYLSDIAWRISPDYRGQDGADQIAYGDYNGIDHYGRAFAALTLFYRNEGLVDEGRAPPLIKLMDVQSRYRARVLAGVMRISNLFCASNPGVLPHLHWRRQGQEIVLEIPSCYQELIAERPLGRLQHLAKLTGQPMRFGIID